MSDKLIHYLCFFSVLIFFFKKAECQSRVRRGCLFFNTVLVLVLLSHSASAEIVKSYTIQLASVCQKKNTLTVFSVSQLPYLTGRPLRQLSFYRFSEPSEEMQASLQAIVFQIDQKDEQDRFVLKPAGDKNMLLSARDELVIRTEDLGEKIGNNVKLLKEQKLVELKVLSESLDRPGFVYINMASSKSSEPARKKVQLNYNKTDDVVSTDIFKIGFSDLNPFLVDEFHWKLDNGQWSDDLSDMMKIRHKGRFFGLKFRRNQDDYSSVLTAVKQGPLRVIRRTENRIKVFWKLKTPTLLIDYIMTQDGFIMDTIIDIPFKISFFFSNLETITTMDWNPDQSGYMSVYSPKLGTAIRINGIDTKLKQTFNTIEDTHFSVATSKGNLDVDLQIPENFPVRAMLYLADKPGTPDPPETFPGQTGNVGFKTIGWEKIDGRLYHLKFTVCINK